MVRRVHPQEPFAGSAFRQYGAHLYRFLLRRVPRPADADDLAQEVFMRLLRISHTERVRKPLAYLYGIASHVLHEFRIREMKDCIHYDSAAVEILAQEVAEPGSADLSESLALQQQLERTLLKLPAGQRAVLLLVKRDGLSHEEAAKVAGLTVQTVEKYMVNAKARMRMEWDR